MDSLSQTGNEAGCKSCGAILKFKPGTNTLECEYCGHVNEISASTEAIEELDFHQHLSSEANNTNETMKVSTVKCGSCSAETTLKPNVTSDECPFCGTALVLKNAHITTSIKPKSLLPFKVDKKQAVASFQKWLGSLWFAPGNLKKYAATDKLNGMYIPYWTYDTNTSTHYTGEQGVNRTETEEYSVEQNGQTVYKTRRVTVTDWYYATGIVYNEFDDLLIGASHSLPQNVLEALEPWDLENLVPFQENYLAGFRSESYQIGLKEGFDLAKKKMEPKITDSIRKDIGGHQQRIHTWEAQYNNITFKHTLLPLWISAYRYNNKSFRFVVNARTGEIKGDRPYSAGKITGAIATGVLALGSFFLGPWVGLAMIAVFLILLFAVFK